MTDSHPAHPQARPTGAPAVPPRPPSAAPAYSRPPSYSPAYTPSYTRPSSTTVLRPSSHIHTIYDYQSEDHSIDVELQSPRPSAPSNIHSVHSLAVAPAVSSAVTSPAYPIPALKAPPSSAAAVAGSPYSDSLPDIHTYAPYPVPLFVRGRRQFLPNFRLLSLTNAIIVGCTAVLIAELVVGAKQYDGAFVSSNPMGGPSVQTLYECGAKWEPAIRNQGQGWRLLSAIWLHSGILHWAMNMAGLAVLGYTIEARLSPLPYAFVFLCTGVLGNLWSSVSYADSVGVGASGAIFGLLGANLTYLLYNWPLIECAVWEFALLVVYAAVGIGIGFLSVVSGNLDNFAHLGGLLCGLAMGMWAVPSPAKRRWFVEASWRLLGLLAFVGLFVLFSLLLWVHNPNGPTDVTNL